MTQMLASPLDVLYLYGSRIRERPGLFGPVCRGCPCVRCLGGLGISGKGYLAKDSGVLVQLGRGGRRV